MKINLFKFERLEKQREELKEKLKIPPDVRVDVAFDSIHGLNDLARSIANLHPHKRSIAVLGAQPPPLQKLLTGFASEGFSVQILPVSFTTTDNAPFLAAWEQLKKDTLFVITAVAEPFTSGLYPFEWIRREAPKKNMFALGYYSPDSLKKGMPIPAGPWESFILDPLWNGNHTLSLVLKGERSQGESLLWGEPHFSEEGISLLTKALESAGAKGQEDQALVTEFEKSVATKLGSSVHFLNAECPRIFDRAVVFVDGVNGESLQSEMTKAGFEVHTGAACAWDDPHLNNWLPGLGISEEKVQSSVLIPLITLRNKAFGEGFFASIETLRKISGYK